MIPVIVGTKLPSTTEQSGFEIGVFILFSVRH